MHPLAARFLRKAVGGVVVICVGVPMLQNQVLDLSTSERPTLSVAGDASGLRPGVPGVLVLTVHNDGDGSAVVRRLTAVPRESVRGCSLEVAAWSGELLVPAGGSAAQALRVTTTGAGCDGVHWNLDYSATA